MGSDPAPVPNSGPADGLPLADLRRVHRACERFEAEHRGGRPPRIEQALADWAGPGRTRLLYELIALEAELRRGTGEGPRPCEYLGRFPDDAGTVEAAFAAAGPGDTRVTTPSDSEDIGATTVFDPEATLPAEVAQTAGRGRPGPAHFGGDYVLLEEVGRGGQGVVYKAYQVSLKRVVALKTMVSGPIASETERERFRLEAERAANLVHSHIVPIHAVGEHDGQVYFTMDLVDGGNLAREAACLVVNPRATARVVASVARAIHFAHGRGFIHCDLKPANILLNAAGKPHVTDFGLSRTVAAGGEDVSREVFGTPSYMAPEQASGRPEEITPATDVYGLGAILYELLTGRAPFRAASTMETVVQVLEREPLPPRLVRKTAPAELERICLKCLEKSPGDRYATADEVADALDGYLRGDDIAGTTLWQNLRRWTRREPELVSRLGGLAIMAALTEYNYRAVTTEPVPSIHYRVQAIFALWAAASVVFQALLRNGRWAERARFAWAATDVIAVTRVLSLLEGFGGDLLVAYPLLIAASGLWFRVRLVWLTTALAMTGYALLYLEAVVLGGHAAAGKYANIFSAALLVTGFVVARQVKRIWALSRYYDNLPGAD